MIDFVKFSLPLDKYKDQFLNRDVLNFKSLIDYKTKEESPLSKCNYLGLKFEVKYHELVISGSIHKFYNEIMGHDRQNFDDFNFGKLSEVLRILSVEFDFELSDTKVQNLEYGVNINTSFCPSSFLSGNLINMHYKEPTREEFDYNKGQYRQFTFSNYIMKVYDKGNEFNLPQNILRVEVKAIRSEVIDSQINTLSDLLSKPKLQFLRDDLLRRTKELLICDDINEAEIANAKDFKLLLQYKNPAYWTTIKREAYVQKTTTGKIDRTPYRNRVSFRALMEKHRLSDIRNEVLQAVAIKSEQLINEVALV